MIVPLPPPKPPLRTEKEREAIISPRPPMKVVRNATTGAVDYAGIPERIAAHAHMPAEHTSAAADNQVDYLDIPAFLRRQAD